MKVVNIDMFKSFKYKGFNDCDSEVKLCILKNNVFYINVSGTSPANMFNEFVKIVHKTFFNNDVNMNDINWYHVEPHPSHYIAYKYDVIWGDNQYITVDADSARFYKSTLPDELLIDKD